VLGGDLALVLFAAYGVVAVLLRALVQLRLTGSTGIKGISGRPGSAEWVGGLLFIVAIVVSVAGAAREDAVIEALDGGAGRVAGAVLAIAGLLATAGAQLAMGDAWRIGVDPGERTRLVTGGPFALVRNPIYAGMIPFFCGIALLVPNLLTLAGAALLVVALEMQTRLVEEPYLRSVHGAEYADYAARVGRFLPGLGRLRR
jgi:protein-S-isoprenylcysteine O-methyltransferase Ste14